MSIDNGPSIADLEHELFSLVESQSVEGVIDWCRLMHTVANNDEERNIVPIVLVEHAKSTIDVAPEKMKKGGVTEIQRFWSNRLFSSGADEKTVINAIKTDPTGKIGLDPGLAQIGIETSQKLAPIFGTLKSEGLLSRTSYSSTHQRPLETAYWGGFGACHELYELVERITPALHLLTKSEITERYPDIAKALKDGKEIVHPDVEPMDWFTHRVLSGVTRVLYEQVGTINKMPIVPIVAHQTVIKVILSQLFNSEVSPFSFDINNTSLTLLIIKARKKTFKEIGSDSELDVWKPLQGSPIKLNTEDLVRTEHFIGGFSPLMTNYTPAGVVVDINNLDHLTPKPA